MARNDVDIRGWKAFITGASSGIGRAVCIALAAEGCHVCGVARRIEELKETMQLCEREAAKNNHQIKVIHYSVDLENSDELRDAVENCVQEFGGLDILVNNAGVGGKSDDDISKWEKCVEVNLVATMRVTKFVLNYIGCSGRGAIINIASVAGKKALKGSAPYVASKYGVVGFTGSLFEDVRERGIKVCAIEPGFVNTPLVADKDLESSKMIQPEDVAKTVLFVLKFPENTCPVEICIEPQRSPYKTKQG